MNLQLSVVIEAVFVQVVMHLFLANREQAAGCLYTVYSKPFQLVSTGASLAHG